MGAIVVGETRRTIDVTIDHARQPQRRVEPVARMGEVRLRRRRPQPRIDADEQQAQPRSDEIGHGGVSERLELLAGETHRRSVPRS